MAKNYLIKILYFQLKTEAIEAYKITLDLDASQKDLILKVIELMLDLPIGDPERTRYVNVVISIM